MKPPRYSALLPSLAACMLVSGDLQGSLVPDSEDRARLRVEAERRMLLALESLWYGTPEVRLETAAEASYFFRPACYPREGPARKSGDAIIASLGRYLSVETDDWIRTRLLDALARTGWCPPLNGLFRRALSEPSLNARRAALRWFAGSRDDASAAHLEDLRRQGVPEWMRAGLLHALSRHESAGDLRDLVRLSDDANLDVALAAVEAIADSDDPRAVEALAVRAGRGHLLLRLEAILALEDREEDPRALEALLEASRAGPRTVRLSALSGLIEFEDPAAAGRLIDAVGGDPDPEARVVAARALAGKFDHPEVVPVLLEVLREPVRPDTEALRQAAVCALAEADDGAILPDLIAMPHDPADPEDPLTGLIVMLGRQEGSGPDCSDADVSGPVQAGDFEDPRKLCVVPPRGVQTVRCWQRPGLAGQADAYPRLPARWSARPEDHYDRDGELWVLLDGLTENQCWVPRGSLEECPRSSWFPTAEVLRVGRLEFDLPTELLSSGPLGFLVESELLRIIDPGDDVTGVAPTFDPGLSIVQALAEDQRATDRTMPDADAIARMETLLRRFRDERLLGLAPSSNAAEGG